MVIDFFNLKLLKNQYKYIYLFFLPIFNYLKNIDFTILP